MGDSTDEEGFISPSKGALAQALYFSTAPSVSEKAKQVLDEGRLELPGVVVVWGETAGRRKGSKAVPKSWWANSGSLTVAFAFPSRGDHSHQEKLSHTAAAVVCAIESFQPRAALTFREPNDLYLGDKKLGAVFSETHHDVDLYLVRLNCSTDLSKAPTAIAAGACRLIDFIDAQQLPLQNAATLANTLLTRLMTEIPGVFANRE